MPNIMYNLCYYLFTILPGKCSHVTPCVYFHRVVSLRRRANWFWSSRFQPSRSRHWAGSTYFSQYFGFTNFLWGLESPDFKSRKLSAILRNSCDEIIWWFWVTIVTVIFTCRYFKLSWNTSALSQLNGRNFPGSSKRWKIGNKFLKYCIFLMKYPLFGILSFIYSLTLSSWSIHEQYHSKATTVTRYVNGVARYRNHITRYRNHVAP